MHSSNKTKIHTPKKYAQTVSENPKLDLPLEVQKQVLTELGSVDWFHSSYLQARDLKIGQFDDWSNFTAKQLLKDTSSTHFRDYQHVLKLHNNSLVHALQAVFPEHQWKPWMFEQVPKHFWEDKSNHRHFFDWAAIQLDLKSPSGREFVLEANSIRLVQC